MLNSVVIQGRLVRQPDRRQTRSGLITADFTVACQGDCLHDGERPVDFISCTAFRRTAEFVSQYFKKGDPIIVVGRLHSRRFQDRANVTRVAWEILADKVYFAGSPAERSAGTPEDGLPPFTDLAGDDLDLPF